MMTIIGRKTICLCVLGILLHDVLSKPLSTDSDSFLNYMKEYDKAYYSSEEFDKRFQIWQQNVDLINQHNKEFSMGLHSYTMGINQFADMVGLGAVVSCQL
ncbi:cystein proteinase inhibitor protein salarin-like [Mercenaria mercenaria]|uniref:cystein proteinase inhibitor protein salarin-like n=1 Tax=Mercenaria mercenaria TaxID=6596 RepID=UPI00234FB571|nr:cystein proteinase inhibitor protein salarin-like [Mercenaria mercenaria]